MQFTLVLEFFRDHGDPKDMVKHFLIDAGKLACGRNNCNTTSTRQAGSVTCKTCITTEAFKNAVIPDVVPRQPTQRILASGLEHSLSKGRGVGSGPLMGTGSSAANIGNPTIKQGLTSKCIVFEEWRRKLLAGERPPRGKYFLHNGLALKCKQDGARN
ncbi:hypothetical protein [Pseudomonas cannabina]|uniref:hypothetical protein n=1 Tax=Pseudomonas cannabina TaxID=86840 RepID=UPI0011C44115|nr:hypothetical protein [Pseudomonas cannabina]